MANVEALIAQQNKLLEEQNKILKLTMTGIVHELVKMNFYIKSKTGYANSSDISEIQLRDDIYRVLNSLKLIDR